MAQRSNIVLRILMHGFFLTSLNLFSAAIAFLIHKLLGMPINYVSSSIITTVACLTVYVLIFVLMRRIQPTIMQLDNMTMGIAILVFSILLQPALIHPIVLFFSETGYNSISFVGELMLPLIINTCCLLVNHFISKPR